MGFKLLLNSNDEIISAGFIDFVPESGQSVHDYDERDFTKVVNGEHLIDKYGVCKFIFSGGVVAAKNNAELDTERQSTDIFAKESQRAQLKIELETLPAGNEWLTKFREYILLRGL